jgi:biopolymer transport protein ExbD
MAIGKLPDGGDDGGDGGDEGIFAEINITPLTDVFLVMVIIFMVSALAVVHQSKKETKVIKEAAMAVKEAADKADVEKKSGIKVNLPSGAAQEIDPSKAALTLTIPMSGDVVVAGKTLRDDELDNLFRAAFARDKTTTVILKADKGVAHGRVVNLMERAKQAGLSRLAIGTSGG